MGVPGTKPADGGPTRFRGAPTHEWEEIPNRKYTGKVPVRLPATRELSGEHVKLTAATRNWWAALRRMPHCRLWSETDWQFALSTALVADLAFRGSTSAATELRQREKILGTTVDARRDLRIRYVEPPKAKATKKTARKGSKAKSAKSGSNVTSLDERRGRLTSDAS